MPSRCAIWARVSTDEQDSGNQIPELRQWAARRGLQVAAEYVLDRASAWKGEHREQLARALADARLGRYDVLIVWALDRIDRQGVESTLACCAASMKGRPGRVAEGAVDRDCRSAPGRAARRALRVDGC